MACSSDNLLCHPVLAFIKAARLRLDAAAIRRSLIDNFRDTDLSDAMRLLWNHSQAKLTILYFVYHVRRDTDKRTANVAVCDDLLQAFDKLDSTSSIPSIFCEAEHLLRIPVLSSDDPASLLKDTSTLVDRLHHDISAISSSLLSHRGHLDSLKSHISSSCAEVNASVGNSLSLLSSNVSAMKDSMSQVSIDIRNQAAPQS